MNIWILIISFIFCKQSPKQQPLCQLYFQGQYCNAEQPEEKWTLTLLPARRGFVLANAKTNERYTLDYWDNDDSDETVTLCQDGCNIQVVFSNCWSDAGCTANVGYLKNFVLREDDEEKFSANICCSLP